MNTFHDLARRVSDMAAPPVDVDGLIAQGEQRRHRRRMRAVLAGVAVVTLIAAGGYVVDSAQHRSNGPVNKPNGPDKQHQVSGSVTRKIVYKDGISGSAVHFDDRLIETDPGFLPMDVTDHGFVYTTKLWDSNGDNGDGRLWFSDGRTPHQIGRPCARLMGPNAASILNAAVITGNAGSLVAWVDCTDPSTPALVALDTSSGQEVVREPTASLTTKGGVCCGLIGLIGEHLYVNRGDVRTGTRGYFDQGLMLDLATGQFTTVTRWRPTWDGGSQIPHRPDDDPGPYLDDIRSNPRGLVLGDTWQTGGASSGIGQYFVVVGSQLVPQVNFDTGLHSTTVFDTTSGRAVHLRLPPNYPESVGFTSFEWLNDDTLALIAGNGLGINSFPGGLRYGDIVTCRLSSGSCHLAVPGPRWSSDADARVVPHLPIPE